MTETKLFQYVARACTKRPVDPNCPVARGDQFSARLDGQDKYRAYQSNPSNPDFLDVGAWFAACTGCQSHKLVEIAEE